MKITIKTTRRLSTHFCSVNLNWWIILEMFEYCNIWWIIQNRFGSVSVCVRNTSWDRHAVWEEDEHNLTWVIVSATTDHFSCQRPVTATIASTWWKTKIMIISESKKKTFIHRHAEKKNRACQINGMSRCCNTIRQRCWLTSFHVGRGLDSIEQRCVHRTPHVWLNFGRNYNGLVYSMTCPYW